VRGDEAEGVHVLVVLLRALDVRGDRFGEVVELAEVVGHGDFGAFHAVVEARVRAAGEVGQEIVGEDLEGLIEYEKKAVDALKAELKDSTEEGAEASPASSAAAEPRAAASGEAPSEVTVEAEAVAAAVMEPVEESPAVEEVKAAEAEEPKAAATAGGPTAAQVEELRKKFDEDSAHVRVLAERIGALEEMITAT
jgi:hypothetical protein